MERQRSRLWHYKTSTSGALTTVLAFATAVLVMVRIIDGRRDGAKSHMQSTASLVPTVEAAPASLPSGHSPHRAVNRTTVGVLVAMITIVVLAGVAAAAWTSNGTGSGQAKAISAQAVVVTAGTSGAAQLFPG